MADCQSSSLRPTLPSLRSLDLPTPSLREKMELLRFNDTHDSYECSTPTRFQPRNRQTSISSSVTATSRSSSMSPPPSDFSAPSSGLIKTSSPTPVDAPRYRLVRSTFENADAVLIVPPPTAPFVPPLSSSATPANNFQKGQGLLLVGSAMRHHLRYPQRNIARGARIHPYRIVRAGSLGQLAPSSALQPS